MATRAACGPGGAIPRYGGPATASWSIDDQPRTGDPLRPGAAPAAIRGALLPEDRTVFDAAYQRALGAARDPLDLTELGLVTYLILERERRVDVLDVLWIG